MITTDVLTPGQARAVNDLMDAVAHHDAATPLDEAARLQLKATARQHGVWHLLEYSRDRHLVGYVSILADGTVQGMVHPDYRRMGHGSALLAGVLGKNPRPAVWVHGSPEPGATFLRARGFEASRELVYMRGEFSENDAAGWREITPADGVWMSTFATNTVDLDDVVALNARAFSEHPEQGRLTRRDFEQRMNEPWFSADDLFVARAGDELAGFVWMKREAASCQAEVYVVAVSPDYEGRGIATSLLSHALVTLVNSGVRTVGLYVEGEHSRALSMYERFGFVEASRDMQFTLCANAAAPGADCAADSAGALGSAGDAESRGDAEGEREGGEAGKLARPIPAVLPTDEYPHQPLAGRSLESSECSSRARDTGLVCDTDGANAAGQAERNALPADRYLDRELSWLAFNERVMELAVDRSQPLLERVRFCSIFASNLDEFFMVRVAGLKRRVDMGIAKTGASGIPPRQVLDLARQRSYELQEKQATLMNDELLPALVEYAGIAVAHWDELSDAAKEQLTDFFNSEVFPVLTPLAVDPAHPFPYISGLALNLVVQMRSASGEQSQIAPDTAFGVFTAERTRVARVKVPDTLPRFIRVPALEEANEGVNSVVAARFVPLEEVIAANLGRLFPGMSIISTSLFRVTRNEDMEVEEDDAENLLHALEKELLRRRFGAPVRLELERGVDPEVREWLVRELGVSESEVFELPRPLDHRGFAEIADIDAPTLHFEPFVSRTHRHINEVETSKTSDIFAAIRKRDILLHHPYDSFSTSVQAFLEQAAADPQVRAIKQTLYRTSGDSPIVDALIDAAQAGTQVLALVEIKARFDEENNISWARKLEQAGVHVVYGIVGLKTHCKLSMVVRQETAGLRRYCHVGTGNYHPKTARLYEDYGLLTCDEQVGEDVTLLFNQLSGYAPDTSFRRLLVAPRTMRSQLIALIEREAEHARAGREARVMIKCNAIVDEAVIDALYLASQAGVQVDVVVRGICALRPGVEGMSDNIRVRSILGRFLEHSRVYAFHNDGDPMVFLGSADMMHRNLDRRVEALVRITDPGHKRELIDMLELQLAPTTQSWHLGPEGQWRRHFLDADGVRMNDAQETVIAVHRSRGTRK